MDAGLGHDHAQRECDQIVEKRQRIKENQKRPRDEKRLRPRPTEEPEDQASGQNLKARVGEENIVRAIPDPIYKKPEHGDGEPRPGSGEFDVRKVLAFEPNHRRDGRWNQIAMLPVLLLPLPKLICKMQDGDHVRSIAVGIGIPGIQEPEGCERTDARNQEFNLTFAGGVVGCQLRLKVLDFATILKT